MIKETALEAIERVKLIANDNEWFTALKDIVSGENKDAVNCELLAHHPDMFKRLAKRGIK